MEASPLLGRNIDRTPDGGRPLTGRTAAVPAILRRPVLPARLIFSVDRQAIALRVASALLSCAVLLALVPRRRLAGSLATAAVLLDLARTIRARFASLFGGISAAVLGRAILRWRAAIVGGGATGNRACALMHGAGRHIWCSSPAWFLLGESAGRFGYQGDRRSRYEQSLRVHSIISLRLVPGPISIEREPMDEVPALTLGVPEIQGSIVRCRTLANGFATHATV
jgi:hypothetical protein